MTKSQDTSKAGEKKNRCEELGIHHAWEDVTPNIVYPTYPPQYPPKTEKCLNCGITRSYITVQREIKEWRYES